MEKYMIVSALLLFVLLAGCIGEPEIKAPDVGDDSGDTAPPEVADETVKVVPKATLSKYPTEMNRGESAHFIWSVSGATGSVEHTAVHFGKVSTPVVSDQSAPSDTAYTYSTFDYSSGRYTVPGTFESYIVIDEAGTYYARAHTVVEGKHVWSDEVVFVVRGPAGQPVREFTIKAGNSGFEPSVIEVKKGDLVVITFEVADDAHANGIRIVSPGWEGAPALMPGQKHKVQFTASNTFDYRVFWLAGSLLKGTGTVKVTV